MDKIDFNDEEVFEKFKDFFDEDDIDEKQAQKIYKGLAEDEKEAGPHIFIAHTETTLSLKI